MSRNHPDHVHRSSRGRFATLLLLGLLLAGLALLFAGLLASKELGAAIILLVVLGTPGALFACMGFAYLKLRVELNDDAVALTLPRAGRTPLFPWQVMRTVVPYGAVRAIDVKSRANPYAPQGLERLVFVRLEQGDRYFNSIWFPRFDDLLAEFVARTGAAGGEENLDAPPAPLPDGSIPPLATSEKLARGCGWTLVTVSAALMALTGIALAFGKPDDRPALIKALLFLTLGYPAAGFLLRYRRPR